MSNETNKHGHFSVPRHIVGDQTHHYLDDRNSEPNVLRAQNEILVDGIDVGSHYRFVFRKKLTDAEIKNGFAVVDLDFYRVADACGFKHPAQQHVIKKLWNPGNRGHNSLLDDINDCIGALKRWKQMIAETIEL